MNPASAAQQDQDELELELRNTLQVPVKKPDKAPVYRPFTAEMGPRMPAPGVLVHPLTMLRSKTSVPSMLCQQAASHASTRTKAIKAHVSSSAVFDSGIVSKPDAEYRLPKLSAAQHRPKSADAVTRSELHLSSANYTAVTAAGIRSGTKNPFAVDESTVPPISKQQTQRPFPVSLVAGNYMHPGCPRGVKTGEQAVQYFSAGQTQGKCNLFLYCNLRNPNSSVYNPYDLVVVDAQAIEPEHFIISSSGMCHIRADDGGNTVSPLHVWLSEVRLFRLLKQMTFFKKFYMVKAWVLWKVKHKDGKFARRARFLHNNHLMLNEWFGETMRELFMMTMSVTAGATGIWQRIGHGWHVANLPASLKKVFSETIEVNKETVVTGSVNLPLRLAFIGHESCTHTIKDFQRIRADMRDCVSQGMDSISAHCHHLLHVLATDVEQELEEAYPEELSRTPLRHTMFQRPNARARCRARKLMVHKYVHLTPIQRYERAQAHSRLLPRAIRLADFLVLGSMLDLSKTAVDLVVRQLLPDMPQICHGEQRVAYKHGLWLVRGEIIPPAARPNSSTVLSLSPTEPDLCTNVSTVMREIVGVAAATKRPLLEPYIMRHFTGDTDDEDGITVPVKPAITDFQAVFKTICDVPALQEAAVGLLTSQYQYVCSTDAMKVLTSIGDLYTFMESFNGDAYLRQKPSTGDIVTDMDIMQRWVYDVQHLKPSLHHELLLFDFSELCKNILELGQKALKDFVRLAREWLYDTSVGVRAVAVGVSEGIHKDAYPKNLEDFLAWINKFGDHFGGDQSAKKAVLQDSSSLAKLHRILDQERSILKKNFQPDAGDSAAHTRELESLTAALDAYVALSEVIDTYDSRCIAAAEFYIASIPVMKAQVLARAREQEQLLKDVMTRARGPSGLANVQGSPHQMLVIAHGLHAELKKIHDTASALQKTQELLARDHSMESEATPLISQVEAALSFLDTRKELWFEVATWTRVQEAFSAANMLTKEVKITVIENALQRLDTAIRVWEEKSEAEGPLDTFGSSEAELDLSKRLRDLHRAWQSALEVLPKLISPNFQARHRLLLKEELSALRAALDDNQRSIDQVLCMGSDTTSSSYPTTMHHASNSHDDSATLEDHLSGQPSAAQACLHAVNFSSTLTAAAERKRPVQVSILNLVGHGLTHVNDEIATQLESVPLWRMLALLMFSGAAMATFDRLYIAASEESNIKKALVDLHTRISCMELRLSTQRKHGCLVIVNLPELLHAVQLANAEMTALLSNHTVRHHLQAEFVRTQAGLAEFEMALCLTDSTQTLWLELSRILSESSAREIVSADMPAFMEVQTRWRVMQVAIKDGARSVAAACAHAGPLLHCSSIMPILKRVQDNLRKGVSSIRDVFPRFHLLSDTEIMSALAHARDPMRLSPSVLSSTFPGVVGLLTETSSKESQTSNIAKKIDSSGATESQSLVISAVKGIHGDLMQLMEPVAADLSPLHEWLGHLESAMRASLRAHTATALLAAPTLDTKLWQASFPQQAVYVADCCAFTFAAEQALLSMSMGGKHHAVNSFSHLMAARLETLSQQIRTAEASQIAALQLLIVAGIGHRDVACTLQADGAFSPSDWVWQRQLRHYWNADAKDCHVRVADARIAYGWEYSGRPVSQEASLLAHCDRALALACAALRRDGSVSLSPAEGQFGVPVAYFGEAMAHVCGRLVVHVGCTKTCTFLEMTRTLQGIVSLGAWGHFCGLDLLTPEMLSFLSDCILRIQSSIAARAEFTHIANVEVSLQHQYIVRDPDALPFGLLYSFSNGAEPNAITGPANSFHVQEFLLQNTRRVVLMSAHSELLLEAVLRKHGLRLAQDGAKAAVTFVKFVLDQQPPGPRPEVLFHKLLTCTQNWQGVLEENDGMTVSRSACVAASASLLHAAMPFASQLIEDIFGTEQFVVHQARPSLAGAALEEALLVMDQRSCPEWRAALRDSAASYESLAHKHSMHDICGRLRYLNREAAIVLLRTLEDLLGHHSCNIIVGPPSCGKTALWKLLMKTLQKAYIEANTDINLVPDDVLKALHVHVNSLSHRELFGCPDGLRSSTQGAAALLGMLQPPAPNLYARGIAAVASTGSDKPGNSSCKMLPQPAGHSWVIVDAPLHGGHADRLVPLLLGQPVFCADGTRARIQHNTRLLWECVDLQQASPLTLSSVGVCVVNMPMIDASQALQDCREKILSSSPLIVTEAFDTVWSKVPTVLHHLLTGIKSTSHAFMHKDIDDGWLLTVGCNMASLAPSIVNSCLTMWDAHAFNGRDSSQQSVPVIELSIMFSIAWAAKGASGSLSLDLSDNLLELLILEAFKSGSMQQIPAQGELWDSYIHPSSSSWTTWAHMLRTQPPAVVETLSKSDGLNLHILQPVHLCLQHIIGAAAASGGNALVEAPSQPDIDTAWHMINAHKLPMSHGTVVQWVSTGCSSSMQVSHIRALVEGATDSVRPALVRGPNFSRVVVQVHDIHCAASTASSPATVPALEFLRALVDTGGFFLPASAQLCSAPDVQMLLYSVSALMPPCTTIQRMKSKLLCVQKPSSSLQPSQDGLFTPMASAKLTEMCTNFMQSLRDSVLVDYQPDRSTSDVRDFLTTAVKEIYSICSSVAPKFLFDISAVLSILTRVHADLATVPFDFIRSAKTTEKLKSTMSGSVMMGLFGKLMESGTDEVLETQHGTLQLALELDASADEIRLEHVWVLLAGELLREASRAAAASSQQHLLVKSVGLMLGDKLQSLCKFYDEKGEQDAINAMAASLQAITPKAQSNAVSGGMNLWQADDSDEEVEQTQETCVRSRLLSGLSKENIRDVAMLAVTFGPIVQIDGPNPRKRAVLPLHPELLQATLLQSLKRIEENLTSAASKSGESDTEDCQWKATAAVHTRFLSRTATYLRDLRFVCTVNWVIASLRRPFSLGCTIIAACSGTEEAAYAAATYVQADVVPLWTNEARGYVSPRLDRCFILRQILKAIVVALTTDKSIVIVAEGSLVDDAEQLVLFQHFVVHGGVAGGVCPEVLREAYQEQPSELVELLEAFGLSHYIEQVFPDLTTPGPTAEPSDDNSHKMTRTGERRQDEDSSVLQALEKRHAFIQELQSKIQDATQYIRMCLCIPPERVPGLALISPSMMSTADVVHAPEHFPDIDLVACQHTILRDTQHLLRPWNDDALAMESEGASDAASPAHLLQQTAQGTVSGLCFIEAVESTDAERPTFGMVSRVISKMKPTIEINSSLSYTAVLARACTKHNYTGKNLTPAQSIAMHLELQKCSKVVLEVYQDGASMLAGINLHCGVYKQRLLLDIASTVHRKHRKLMRTQLGYVSHLLRISSTIRSTCNDLRSELSISSQQESEQQGAVSDSRQQLAQLTARMDLLRSAQEELQTEIGKSKDAIADIKERSASEVETIRSRYQVAVDSVLQLAEKDVQELRTYANPPATITHVLAATCTILGFPTDWESALMLLNHATVPFIDRITQFDIATIGSGRLAQLRALTADEQLDPLRVRSVSRAAHSIVLWIHAVDSYGRVEDVRVREHKALREELDRAATKQALLEENTSEVHALESTMMTLKQQLAAVTHDNILIDTSMSARRAQIKILEEITTALTPRVKTLKARVASLQQRLSNLLGDSILAAALVVFGGMQGWPGKLAAVKRWTACMRRHKVPHTADFSLCETMEFLEQRHLALPRSVILSESLRHAMYSMALVRGVVFLVDPEGEAINLRKALHAQGSMHRWLDLRLDSGAVIDDALGAAAADSMVALEVVDLQASEHLIWLLARRAMHLPAAAVSRVFLHTQLEGPWPLVVQQHTIMISFRAERDTTREHVRSTLISVTDQKIEDTRRAVLASIASSDHECHDIQHALYQLAATLQSNCWMDPALSGAVLQRLQDLNVADGQLKKAQEQLEGITSTLSCLDPLVGAADAMWDALKTLADRSAIFDMPLLHALRWWEHVFTGCLRRAHENLLADSKAQKGKSLSSDGSSCSLIQPSPRSSESGSISRTGDANTTPTAQDRADTVPENSPETDLRESLKLPLNEINPVGDGSTTEVADEASFADAIQVEGESSADPDTSATRQQALDSNAIQRSMLDFVAREVPENKFCLALVQSVSLWFDQLSGQLLIAAFHMSLAAGKGAEHQNSVRLLCDMLSQKCPTLQLSSSDQAAHTTHIKGAQEDQEHSHSTTTTEHEDIELHKRATEWLNSQVLGALSWLEEHLYNFKGLHDHAVKNPVAFYKAAMHLEPFKNLPEPFSHFTPFLRLLLGVTLQPNATHAALEWYSFTSMQQLWPSEPPQATTPRLDSGARMTAALQIAPSHCYPVLLHCNVPHAVVSTLHVLLSIYRCGMALLNAPTSRSLQLLASSTKFTPRRAQTSLKVIHASKHLQSAAVLETVSTAATDGNWVLIACAHLRPDLIPAIVRLVVMLQDNTSTSAYFKIFFSCPSESLPTIPLRSSMMCMMCGPEQSTCEAVSLLRAADSPLADRMPLIKAPQDLELDLSAAHKTFQGTGGFTAHATPPSTGTGSISSSVLSPVQLQLLQTLAIRVAIAVAQVESQIRSSSAHASFLCTLVPTITARDFVHVLWLIYEHVRLAPDSRSLRMGELRSAIAQVAFEQCHGPTAHRSAALTILQQHLPAGSTTLSHTGLPANTFSELFNKATVQVSKLQFAQTESDVPTFHAWKSQQVLSFFLRSQTQQVPGSISLRVIPPPWMAVSVDCAHLQRELQNLQASIQAAWTHVQSHISDLCGTGESGEPDSKTAGNLPEPSSINPDGQADESSEDDEEPPSLMIRLPYRSEIDALLKERGVSLAASEPPQADRPIASEASQAAVTRLSIVNRPRLSTAGASRSHRAVSLGPKTSTRGSRARTGGHNSIVSQHPASRAAQQSATQSTMRPFGSQHGTKSVVSKSFGGNDNGIPSRFSSRPRSRHACHRAADTYNQPQMGVERSCSSSEQLNSNLGGADDPEKGNFGSPNASRSPSCGIKFHSQVHRTLDSRSISPQRSTEAATGTTTTLTFARDAVSQSSVTGSEEDSQAGASPHKQSDTANPAAEAAVGAQGVVAPPEPPQKTPSRKSVQYHADSMVLGAKTMAHRNSLRHLMLSQRIQTEKRCKLFPFECVLLALAQLSEVVCRASQCIAILKTCADYGTDLPVPLHTLLESLVHSTGPLEWNLDSLQHSSQPRAARKPNSLFWRPYMLKSEMDSWLGGVQKQLYVLQCMAAALRTFQSKESSEAANAEVSIAADRPPLPFSAVARPRAVVASAKRLLSQAQNIPLQNITCNAVLTTAAAHKAAAAANSSCKHAAVFSISPTAWQDVDESTPAQLRIDNESFWCPRDWGPLTGDTPVLVVNPVRSIKGSCTATSVSRKVDQDQEFSQAVDQLMVHRNGSFLRLMEFDDVGSGGAKKRTRNASWAGLLSG